MAWWDMGDQSFLEFLALLFGQDPQSQINKTLPLAVALAPAAEETKEIVEEQAKEGAPSPAPSPSTAQSAAPAPQQTPAPRKSGSKEDALASIAARYPGTTQTSSQDPYALTPQSYVWESRSPKRVVRDPDSPGRQLVQSGGDKVRTLAETQMDPYRWDGKKAKTMAQLMEDAGFDTKGGNIDQMASIWGQLSQTAARFWLVGKRVSPLDILKRTADGQAAAAPRTTTSTQTSVSLTNALTAEQLAHAALSQRLGRRATDVEVEEFKRDLLAAEKKNPTTTTTTTTTDPKGNTSSSSSSKEGLNASDFAVDWSMAHNKDEAAAYQAAGVMIPWLFEALKAPV